MAQNPIVTFHFRRFGFVTAELFPEHAPETVRNFLYLIRRGYLDGMRVHRVVPGYMLQSGCPLGRGVSGPGYGIRGEFSANGFDNPLLHTAGALTMLRSDLPDSAGSQFAILNDAIPSMDGMHAVFGQVQKGLDVVRAMTNVCQDSAGRPYFRPRLERVEAETFGVEYPKPAFLDLQRRVATFR